MRPIKIDLARAVDLKATCPQMDVDSLSTNDLADGGSLRPMPVCSRGLPLWYIHLPKGST
jgi:hypothetical protein